MKINRTALAVVGISLWLPLVIFVWSLQGCQLGTTGLLRPFSPGAEHGITNAVGVVQSVAAGAVPQPWSTAIEAGGAAVLALLAAWQGLTHSKVQKIEALNTPPTKGSST